MSYDSNMAFFVTLREVGILNDTYVRESESQTHFDFNKNVFIESKTVSYTFLRV